MFRHLWRVLDRAIAGGSSTSTRETRQPLPSPFFTRPGEDDTLRAIVAYEFKSDLTLNDMLRALNAGGPWQWQDRDSAWPINEISTGIIDQVAVVRIYEEAKGFNLSVFFKTRGAQAEQAWRKVHDAVVKTVLPTLGAGQVEQGTAYEPPASWWRGQ